MSGDQHEYFGTAPQPPYVSPEGIAAQGVTEVDVESLASAVSWLNGLKSYIETHLVPDTNKMTITQGDSELWFGGLDSASQVSTLHSTYVKTMIDSYKTVAKSLDAASKATADIVKNYRDVEHNNTLTARNIDAAFASASSPGGGSTADTTGGTSGNVDQSSGRSADAPSEGAW